MRINHNLPAINTYHQLSKNQLGMGSVLEKLSSGLRINRAADDAAGLTISHKMRSQIRGLAQADRNILDGISLVQTAEGGLAGIQDMVQRMRELTVQAANGTLTEKDRTAIQAELEELKEGVDGIARETDFNGTRPLIQEVTTPNPPDLNESMVDIVFFVDYSSSMGYTNSPETNLGAVMEGISGFVDTLAAKNLNARIGIVSISTQKPHYRSLTDNVSAVKNNLSDLSNWDTGTKPYENMELAMPDGEIGKGIGYRPGAEKVFVLFTDVRNEAGSGDEVATAALLEGETVEEGYGAGDIQTYVFSFGPEPEEAFDSMVHSTGGKLYPQEEITDADSIKSKLSDSLAADISNNTGGSDITAQKGVLQLQVGANETETMEIRLSNATTFGLGIHNVSVMSDAGMQSAIGSLDQALENISAERSKYGAYQNALEYIGANAGIAGENLTAAESRISDAEMAKEMTDFTRRNILNQSAQAMLAQSNQLPQGILQLLQ